MSFPQISAENASFIKTEGSLFITEDTNRPWFYAGTNNYYAGVDHYALRIPDEIISDMVAMNLNVLRLWGFNDDQSKGTKLQGPNAGDFIESNLQKLDYILHIANQNDIRVIMPLTNYWNDYGGMRQYVSWAGDSSPSAEEFYTNSTAKTYFRNYISYLANRVNTYNSRVYKDDPTILAWQLANEPEYTSDTYVGNGSYLTDWINETADFMKSTIGVNQLVTTGMEGFYDSGNALKGGENWFDNKGTCFIIQHSSDDIDLAGFHIYQDWWGIDDSQSIMWIANHIRDARRYPSLQKPVIMDEYGRRVPESPMSVRDEAFKNYLRIANRELANGTNFWILYHDTYYDYDHFGVYYPDDASTVEIIKNHTNKIKVLNDTGVHQLISFEYDDEDFNKIWVAGGQVNSITRVGEPSWYMTNDGTVKISCSFAAPGDKVMIGAELEDTISAQVGINVSDYGYNYLVVRVMVEGSNDFEPEDLSVKLYDKTGDWVYADSNQVNIEQTDIWYEISWPTASAGDLSDLKELGIDVWANGDYNGNIYVDFIGGDLTGLFDNVVPGEIGVVLEDIDSGTTSPQGNYRWMDSASQLYADSYRNSYDYTQSNVQVGYYTNDTTLYGTITAENLKPNFTYQVKLVGNPEEAPAANERIGLVGRWWQEQWDDTTDQWSNGQNLNDKGDGSSPNPNDEIYYLTRDIPDSDSPTGKKYRYTGYLVYDYFITDENGNAIVTFNVDSSYHVLWKTSQRSHTSLDGPLKTRVFDVELPDPAGAYDIDYSSATVSVFGEWERLPVGGIKLPIGNYEAELILTEESFHEGGLGGGWAAAVGNTINFAIAALPEDLNQDNAIDLLDLEIMQQFWLETGLDIHGDINNDGIVDLLDFAEFAGSW